MQDNAPLADRQVVLSSADASQPSVEIRVPTEATASCNGTCSLPCTPASPSRQHQVRCRSLHLLSPTIEIDVGAADYDTVYPRLFSLEYLVGVAAVFYVLPYGFLAIRRFCDRHMKFYLYHLRSPDWLLWKLGSDGYDNLLDQQWSGYVLQLPRLFFLAVVVAAGSAFCRYAHARADRSVNITGETTSFITLPTFTPSHLTLKDEKVRSSSLWVRLLSTAVIPARRCCQPRAIHAVFSRPWCLPVFYTIVGVIFMAIVHGPHFFLPLLLIFANYAVFTRLQRGCPYWVFMALMWAAHVALLYTIERHAGFEDAYWLQYLAPSDAAVATRVLGTAAAPRWRTHMRWFIAFRMTTLRLIAFNYDCWEAAHRAARARERAADRHDTACVECAQLREQNANANANANASRAAAAAVLSAEASRCYKYRTEHARDTADYGLANYLAYVVFPPLYLAGPMSSFNAFVSYMRVPSTAMPPRKMTVYALRILGLYLTEYVLMHFIHVAAVANYTFLVWRMNLLELSHFFLYSLAYTWLKFSFIWKSSRLFAMLSGIEVPEDMRRCFSNTLSIRDFWRDWHASFNLWIVRYMYVPLGGRARVALSIMPIFLFIALWHDPALHLLKWALCIAAMFVVELAVCACFSGVVDVFRRAGEEAVEAQGSTEERDGAGDGRGTPPRSPRAVTRAAAPPLVVVLRPAARLAARRLTARARAWAYRLLRVLGGMCTIFGLIVANLIGFSMQNWAPASAERKNGIEEPSEGTFAVWPLLKLFTPWFAFAISFSMFVAASLAVIDRDMEAARTVSLKKRYGLR